MTIEFKKYQKELLFIPLTGTEEIGLNLNLYHYEGKWLMIDLGIGFTQEIPGVDILVPDIRFIEKIKKDLLGIVVTHAHEDHLGAIPHLWEKIGVPIYTSNFTGKFLLEKLREYNLDKKVPINLLEQGAKFDLGPFGIELFELNHSVPEMNAALITTKAGIVMHTGDWKFDENPVIGKIDDFKKLAEIGRKGVLSLVCDSTNVFSAGHSGSEGDLQVSLIKLVAAAKNMVVVASFASNLSRLVSVMAAAKKTKRKLVICGRALDRMTKIGIEEKIITDTSMIISREEVKNYPRNKLIIMATGCQGEENAALRKMAKNEYPYIKLLKNDTVIFSSKIIPGNDIKIHNLMNLLASKQIQILTERDSFVHVSGHPNQEELKKLYDLVKPAIAIPVHGEIMHINKHADLAENFGVKRVVRATNGACILLSKNRAEVIGQVHTGYMAVDGNSLIDIHSPIFKARKKISLAGLVIVTIKISGKSIEENPKITAPGLFDSILDKDIILYLQDKLMLKLQSVSKIYISADKRDVKIDEAGLKKEIAKEISKIIEHSIKKSPVVEVLIFHSN